MSDLLSVALEHEGALRKILWRHTRNWADVDDLLQDTYARLLHRSAAGVQNVRAYVMRSALNAAIEHYRHRACVPIESMADAEDLVMLGAEGFHHDIFSTHQRAVRAEDELEELVRAVKRLPVKVQQAFILIKVYGFTHQEVKERTRMTQATLERRLTDALCMLSAILGRPLSNPNYTKEGHCE